MKLHYWCYYFSLLLCDIFRTSHKSVAPKRKTVWKEPKKGIYRSLCFRINLFYTFKRWYITHIRYYYFFAILRIVVPFMNPLNFHYIALEWFTFFYIKIFLQKIVFNLSFFSLFDDMGDEYVVQNKNISLFYLNHTMFASFKQNSFLYYKMIWKGLSSLYIEAVYKWRLNLTFNFQIWTIVIPRTSIVLNKFPSFFPGRHL